MIVGFEQWTRGRTLQSVGTNFGSQSLPFQDWRRFKEAFAPELVERAVRESQIPVNVCLDPFGGSGTTALACQFLGIHPATIEVNPFLADLIAAKLTKYDTRLLVRDLGEVLKLAAKCRRKPGPALRHIPQTFIEPGVDGRWLFDYAVASRIVALRFAIESLALASHGRLFRVLLGGILVEVSNVVTSGKGRRYRRNWDERRVEPHDVNDLFGAAASSAIEAIHRYSGRRHMGHSTIRGDARSSLKSIPLCDLSVFSPPYPNSFDYTDIYNLELWMLGYLTGKSSNRDLRISTLSSHVQISRDYAAAPRSSQILNTALYQLGAHREELWNRHIPEMVGAYFAEMNQILREVRRSTNPGGSVWIVVGDSQYADVRVRSAQILGDLAASSGWTVNQIEECRAMRASAQQGGMLALSEGLVVLSKV